MTEKRQIGGFERAVRIFLPVAMVAVNTGCFDKEINAGEQWATESIPTEVDPTIVSPTESSLLTQEAVIEATATPGTSFSEILPTSTPIGDPAIELPGVEGVEEIITKQKSDIQMQLGDIDVETVVSDRTGDEGRTINIYSYGRQEDGNVIMPAEKEDGTATFIKPEPPFGEPSDVQVTFGISGNEVSPVAVFYGEDGQLYWYDWSEQEESVWRDEENNPFEVQIVKWEGDTSVVENLNKDEYTGEIVNSSGEIVGFKFNYEGVEYGVVIPNDGSVTGISVGFTKDDEFRVTGVEAGEQAVIYDFEHELYLPMAKGLGDLYATTVEIDKRTEQKRAENGESGDEDFDWSVKGSYKHNTGLYAGISDSDLTAKMKKFNLGVVDYMTVHVEEGGYFEIVEFGYQDKDGADHDNLYAIIGGHYEGVSLFEPSTGGSNFKANYAKDSFVGVNLMYRLSINSTASGLWPIWYMWNDILIEQGLSDAEMEDFVTGLDYRAGIESPEGIFILVGVFAPQ